MPTAREYVGRTRVLALGYGQGARDCRCAGIFSRDRFPSGDDIAPSCTGYM